MSARRAGLNRSLGLVRKILATITGNLYLVLGSVLLGLLAVPASWLPPRRSWALLVMRLWSCSLLAAGRVRVEAHFDPGIDPAGRYIFLSNHQSLFDIPVLLAALPGQVRMVAKESLFRIPAFGWALAAGGFIPVDRGDRGAAHQSFTAAEARLREGASVLLFPEGTRGAGEVLLPFRRGGLLLALRSGLAIVPVGIRGTREVQRRGSFTICPGTVVVRFGEPLDLSTQELRRSRVLTAEVRRRVAELSGSGLGSDEP